MLADAEEVDADLIGKDALLDDIADRLGVRVGPSPCPWLVRSPNVSSPRTSGNAPSVPATMGDSPPVWRDSIDEESPD